MKLPWKKKKKKERSSARISEMVKDQFHRRVTEDTVIFQEKPNRALGLVLKILVVIVLALGTKKFALGITLSTFLLFFLEKIGKHVCRFLKPCSKAKQRFRSMVLSCPFVVSDGKSSEIEEAESDLVSRVEEIRYTVDKSQENSFCDQESKCEIELNAVMEKEKDFSCEMSDFEIRKLFQKAKIRSKMKIVMLNKLKNFRKKPKDIETEFTPIEDDKFAVLEEAQETEYHLEPRFEHESESSGIVNVNDALMMVIGNESSVEREENYGYMVLFLIALLGLVQGRILALVFILAWCFLLRTREAIKRQVNVLTFRSFTTIFRLNL